MHKVLPWIALVLSVLAISISIVGMVNANAGTTAIPVITLPDYPCTGGSC